MLKLNQIQAIHSGMKADVETMQAVLDGLNNEIVRIKSDGTRHDDWVNEKVEEARDKVLPILGETLGTFGSRFETTKSQKQFWASKPFVLSQQSFNDDPVKDATIRMVKGSEFSAMDSALLQLAADSALFDGDLPMIWQAYLAGVARNGQPGWKGVDLADLEIPEQALALRLIQECEGFVMKAHDIAALASSGGLTPVRKMQTHRAMA